MKKGIIALITIIAFSAGTLLVSAQTQPRSRQMVIPYGKSRIDSSAKLSVRFLGVVEDSRCPKGVNCVWAGAVTVKISVSCPGKEAKAFELSSLQGKETIEYEGKRITLVRVTPYPQADKPIRKANYRVTLKIEPVN
ncbi:MAG: hypothetical protein AB1477_03720 [Acidobacteriota bacterium]